MAARTYRVALGNQISTSTSTFIPVPLKLISANIKEGGWTSGWSPPSTIDKNSGDPGAAPGTSPAPASGNQNPQTSHCMAPKAPSSIRFRMGWSTSKQAHQAHQN
jgi:hypothetical protein